MDLCMNLVTGARPRRTRREERHVVCNWMLRNSCEIAAHFLPKIDGIGADQMVMPGGFLGHPNMKCGGI